MQGERHPKTTTILLNIGVQNFDAGDLARATVQYRAAADRFEEVLGPDHPSVALALTNLASALALLDDRDAAIEANERALEILQGALPPDHDSVLFAMTTMAGLLASVRADEAVAMYERAIVAIEAKFGPNHLKLAEPLAKIGSIHAVLGDPAVALPYLARSLAIMRASLPEDHSDLALPLWGEGTAYVELGRYDEAIAVLEPALALSEIEYGPDHVDLIDSLVKLGIAYHEVGRDRDAVASLERAYKIEVASGEAESEHMSVFPLAQALWSSEEERPRALGLARGAYEALPADDEDRAEIGDWLARRGVELSPPRD